MGSDPLIDPGASGDPPHDPGGVALEAPAISTHKEAAARSPMARSMARATRGARGHGDDLVALAAHREGAVSTLKAEGVDTSA
jgi:hypothetical protein